jgi:nitroreductase
MNTLDAILTRQSCRAYKDEQITEDNLQKLLIAANAAPVGMGLFDAVSLTVIQDKEIFSKIEEGLKALMPNNPNPKPMYNAPTCILVSVKKEDGPFAAMHPLSASCIMENILIEATELSLGSTYIMGAAVVISQSQELCTAAKVPDGFTPVAMAAVGHSILPIEKREENIRKLAVEIV